jgi:uncharacterized membrane protein YfcA
MKLLFVVLGLFVSGFICIWVIELARHRSSNPSLRMRPTLFNLVVGFIANFFDTLGIGSFATTSAFFKLWGLVRDEQIPGTLNVGNTIPSVLQAFIYISIVQVDIMTLSLMISASVFGAWAGARVVSGWPRRNIQICMGIALLLAAVTMLMTQLSVLPPAGEHLGLTGLRLATGLAGNFIFAAIMMAGIGFYAPCLTLVSLLGMSPRAAFPIMMGSCAFMMPVGSIPFIRRKSYDVKAAIGIAVGGVPAVLLAAYLVRSLPLVAVRWLVIVVVTYTAMMMLRSAVTESRARRRAKDLAGEVVGN